jgi:hypothetical protein
LFLIEFGVLLSAIIAYTFRYRMKGQLGALLDILLSRFSWGAYVVVGPFALITLLRNLHISNWLHWFQ